jgi:hypothetical protein
MNGKLLSGGFRVITCKSKEKKKKAIPVTGLGGL